MGIPRHLGNFLYRADPIDSEAHVSQQPFSFGVRKRTPQRLQNTIIDAIFAEMPESLYNKRGLAIAASQRLARACIFARFVRKVDDLRWNLRGQT
jgi:hypothetical protein